MSNFHCSLQDTIMVAILAGVPAFVGAFFGPILFWLWKDRYYK